MPEVAEMIGVESKRHPNMVVWDELERVLDQAPHQTPLTLPIASMRDVGIVINQTQHPTKDCGADVVESGRFDAMGGN